MPKPSPKPPTALVNKRLRETRRAAKPGTCPKCKATILVGESADCLTWTAKVDLSQCDDKVIEIVERLRGRFSYDLITRVGRPELHVRESHHFNAPSKWPIVLDHRCQKVTLW